MIQRNISSFFLFFKSTLPLGFIYSFTFCSSQKTVFCWILCRCPGAKLFGMCGLHGQQKKIKKQTNHLISIPKNNNSCIERMYECAMPSPLPYNIHPWNRFSGFFLLPNICADILTENLLYFPAPPPRHSVSHKNAVSSSWTALGAATWLWKFSFCMFCLHMHRTRFEKWIL